jgi:hypothetical protein
MVEEVLIALLDRRLTVNPGCVTVGHEVINSKINPTPVNDALVVLGRELKRVSDDGKTISGKAGGLDDDAAMALFLGVYWYVTSVVGGPRVFSNVFCGSRVSGHTGARSSS